MTNTPTADPTTADMRGEIAAGMTNVAVRLVGLVRDWDDASISELLGRLSGQQQAALCVVLAAMVDQDKTPGELLAWCDGAELAARTREEQNQ